MECLVKPPLDVAIRTLFTLGFRTITPRPRLSALTKNGSIVPNTEEQRGTLPACRPFSMHKLRLQIPGMVDALGKIMSKLSADRHPFVANMLLRGHSSQSATKGMAICSNPNSFTIFNCTLGSD